MLRLSIVFISLMSAQPALATAPLQASALVDQCSALVQASNSVEGRLCDAYLRGFLDGVSSAGGKQRAYAADENWTQRAARTRLGTAAMGRISYCVPSDLTAERLARLFLQQVESNPETKNMDAQSALEATLYVNYRCVPG